MRSRSKGGVKEKHWFEKTNGVSLPYFLETREREAPVTVSSNKILPLMMAAARKTQQDVGKNRTGMSRGG